MRIPETPPPWAELMARLKDPARMKAVFEARADSRGRARYFHWEDLKYRTPPKGCTREDWWLNLKIRRMGGQQWVPLIDKSDRAFNFVMPEIVIELLHQIDRNGGTLIEVPEPIYNPEQRDRYLVRSLMEEAITSSQLEGAATTREVAKKMLAEGRKPRDRSEQMILNNFRTMQHIIEVKDEPLTPELVFEIHRRISGGALDIADGAGRFRRPDENINVSDLEGNVFHLPPSAETLVDRMEAMCQFANGSTPDYFIHPVIRGIILHFWLAYDHPFVDGNGRTARALFYWSMLHSGYWLFEFISISQILRKAPIQYGTAFLHTETDDNDLTYFIIHQSEVIKKALLELHDYVARKSQETRASMGLLENYPNLNHRQQALLSHAIKHPNFSYNIAGHMARQGVVYDTARFDLLELVRLNLLIQSKVGKAFAFRASPDLEARLKTSHAP